jgi:hypothetical protein
VAAVREGMAWIIPVPLLSLVTAQHLEQLVCGLPHISIQLLRRVVRYQSVFYSARTYKSTPLFLQSLTINNVIFSADLIP